MGEVVKKSIFDGAKYLYAEQLKGNRVTVTIKSVTEQEIVMDGGKKSDGFCVAFNESSKMLIIAGNTVRRQIAMATGTENPDEMAGKKIVLYPVKQQKSVSGLAIRIGIPEHQA
jgi:hypothetical protein